MSINRIFKFLLSFFATFCFSSCSPPKKGLVNNIILACVLPFTPVLIVVEPIIRASKSKQKHEVKLKPIFKKNIDINNTKFLFKSAWLFWLVLLQIIMQSVKVSLYLSYQYEVCSSDEKKLCRFCFIFNIFSLHRLQSNFWLTVDSMI